MSSDSKKNVALEGTPQGVLDRRSFLQILGAGFAMAALPETLTACGFTSEPSQADEEALQATSTLSVVRPDDLLVLTFGLVNLRRDSAANRIVKTDPTLDAYMLVDFPPQAFIEDAFVAGSLPAAQATARMGGKSRLVFKLPKGFAGDAYTLDRLLAICGTSDLVIPAALMGLAETIVPQPPRDTTTDPLLETTLATALAPNDPAAAGRLLAVRGFTPPAPTIPSGPPASAGFTDRTVSYVEMPHRLLLAPNTHAAWGHATLPVMPDGKTAELWHSYLGTRTTSGAPIDERNAFLRTARAVWTRDQDPFNNGTTADTVTVQNPSLYPGHREKIVQLTSGQASTVPLQVDRMMLSSLGGYLDVKGDFRALNDNALVSWAHKMTGGREHFVEVMEKGITLPFGNAATFTLITKRSDDAADGRVGTLFQWGVVNIHDPVMRFPDAGSPAKQILARQFPFVAIELKEKRFVVKPPPAPVAPQSTDNWNFWAQDLLGQPIWVPVIGHDRRGRTAEFAVPLFMMMGSIKTAATQRATYQSLASALPQALPMNGTRIAYATSRTDNTTFATTSIALDLQPSPDAGETNVLLPVLASMTLDIESIKSFTDGQPRTFGYHGSYAQSGLPKAPTDANKSQYLFRYVPSDPAVPYISADVTKHSAGGTGFVAPNINFNAISCTTGPANDGSGPPPASLRMMNAAVAGAPADGGFDPNTFMSLATGELEKIKILGVFSILDIIKAVDPDTAAKELNGLADNIVSSALRYAPKFVADGYHELERLVGSLMSLKSQLETLYAHGNEVIAKAKGAVNGAIVQAQNGVAKTMADVQSAIQAVIDATKALYATLGVAVENVQNMDITTLLGVVLPGGPPRPATTTLEDFRHKAAALRAALKALADLGAKGAVDLGLGNGQVTYAFNIVGGIFNQIDSKLQAVEDIVGTVNSTEAEVAAIVDKIQTLFTTVQQALDTARDLTLKLDWQPKISPWFGGSVAAFVPANEHILTLAFEVRAKASNGKEAGLDVSCRLDSFHFYLGGTNQDAAVILSFDHLFFAKESGKKPDVDVVFGGISFGGPLAFLETLRRLIPLDGFSDPPYLDVDASGIRAGFTLAIPNVAVGMFSMENIKISADLVVPFFSDGPAQSLKFTFSFCDRDHPFLVTVAMLGGGGYFIMSVTPSGIEHIEASISVGAQLAIDFLGLAQGSISIMAGMTFIYDSDKNEVSLTAFLRLHGELDVLGLISISIDLRIDMTYDFVHKKLTARAVLHVAVHVVFFSTSVDLPFERKFAGTNGDPTLRQLMGAGQDPITLLYPNGGFSQSWDDYCLAYA